MPDFNKGDFTQQGVAGHVNANLRLNEKRLVNIDMTSNEEAEGCTITGAVTDLLNDKVYNIGSGVSGNIEITENGENINVAPYATATVNVSGGGGLPTMTANIINNTGEDVYADSAYVIMKSEYTAEPFEMSGATATIEIFYSEAPQGILANFGGLITDTNGLEVTAAFSDLVNCEAVAANVVQITDPSQPSSATVTFTTVS